MRIMEKLNGFAIEQFSVKKQKRQKENNEGKIRVNLFKERGDQRERASQWAKELPMKHSSVKDAMLAWINDTIKSNKICAKGRMLTCGILLRQWFFGIKIRKSKKR